MRLSNDSVMFEVTEEGQVAFYTLQPNGEWGYEYSGKDRVKNTRFLLKCFHQACKEYKYLFCTAFKDDGYGETRKEVFNKLGFEYRGWGDESTQVLEWGVRVTLKVITPKEVIETFITVEKELREHGDYWEIKTGNPEVLIFAYSPNGKPLEVLTSYLASHPDSSYEKLGFIFN